MDHISVLEWLRTRDPRFVELSNEELAAIADFLFAWSYFESRFLETKASVESICVLVDNWQERGQLAQFDSKPFLSYFQNRYIEGERLNKLYSGLNFRQNDKREIVEEALMGRAGRDDRVVQALLIIVYRLRNNLMHGVKWRYGIKGQEQNFLYASSLLASLMDLDMECAAN